MHVVAPPPAPISARDVESLGRDIDALDPRIRAAWKTWLSALATDAQAAIAAAYAYESLPDDGRDAWLDALEADAPLLDVSPVALYAPLLAVERGEARRQRIEDAIGGAEHTQTQNIVSLRGVSDSGKHVCVIVTSAYLEFVQVLACHYTPSGGFQYAKHDPLCHEQDAPRPGSVIENATLETTPLRVVVEELAHAVLADRRLSRGTPEALVAFAHLFGPVLEGGAELE